MKTFLKLAAVLSLCCLAPAAFAQGAAAAAAPPAAVPTASAPAVSTAALHDELRKMRDDILAAIDRGDVDGVLQHLHPNVIFTPMNGEVCRGPVAVRAYFDKMMKGPDRIVDSVHLDLKVDALTDLYGDAGVAYGSSDDHYKLASGLDFPVHTRWTCSLVRQNGRWLITSFQAAPNAFDNPILHQKERAAALKAGIAGIVAGLLLGAVLARVLTRRRGS
jgi:hypothetical protein